MANSKNNTTEKTTSSQVESPLHQRLIIYSNNLVFKSDRLLRFLNLVFNPKFKPIC